MIAIKDRPGKQKNKEGKAPDVRISKEERTVELVRVGRQAKRPPWSKETVLFATDEKELV